jgi:polyisoprenoid-binding protein YceI
MGHNREGDIVSIDSAKSAALRFVVDTRLSGFTVQAFAGGFLSGFAHSPTFAIRGMSSEVWLDPEDLHSASLRIEIQADSLQLLDEVNEGDRREIERVMRQEAMETATYPTIVFQSTGVTATRTGEGQYSLTLEGDLSLHGVTRRFTMPARVLVTGDTLRAFGEFWLKLSDYKIKRVSVAGGAIKVKDELKFSFDLVARKQD